MKKALYPCQYRKQSLRYHQHRQLNCISFSKNFRECCGMTASEFRNAVDCYNRSLYQNTFAMNNLLNAPEDVYLAKRDEPFHSSGRKSSESGLDFTQSWGRHDLKVGKT